MIKLLPQQLPEFPEFLAYLFILGVVVFDTEFLLQFFNGIVRIRQWAMQMYAFFKISTIVAVLT